MPRRRTTSTTSTDTTATATTARENGVPPSPYVQPQEMASMYDYLAKIILLGPSGCGKSCILHRFVKNEWRILASQTVGVEFASKIVRVGGRGGKRVKLQLWDTAGTERFRSVSRSYYRGAAGAVLVYDVTDQRTFEGLGEFLSDARALGSEKLSCVVVGNKRDLVEEPELAREVQGGQKSSSGSLLDNDDVFSGSISSRTGTIGAATSGNQRRATSTPSGTPVPSATAARWAQTNRIPAAMEVSALSGDGVDEIFHKLARTILTKIELGEIDPDDPMSGIQYGDSPADGYGYADGGSSVKSYDGLTSDGYGRGRRRKAGWGGVFRLGGRPGSSSGGGGGGCC